MPCDAMFCGCVGWPRAELPDGYRDPVTSDVPVLLLSGALDPVTPPRWAEVVAKNFPNSTHAVAPGAGHNVAVVGCTPDVMAEFVETGTTTDLDTSCIETVERPPFFLDFAGPKP